MGTIQKLPQHLINRLKAGEIVERPASVVKELIENSLDAGAMHISLDIEKGGKQLIKITDDGAGISKEDMLLTIERYATSKIINEKDLNHILSYGFRGEALATISEVSGFRIQSRAADHHALGGVGYELWRDGSNFSVKDIPFEQEHGTIVSVTDIFYSIPAREKFLKSDATEWRYIKKLFIDYAIVHRDKQRSLTHNGKQIFLLFPCKSLMERVIALTKKDRQPKLKSLEIKDEQLHLYGLVGDASLHFPKGDWLHLFVNRRPVEDRLLKKAVMDAYQRQIMPGTYPFALLFIDIEPGLVDVNIHPRKQQVKFLDPGSIFTRVKGSIQGVIGEERVNYAAFNQKEVRDQGRERRAKSGETVQGWKDFQSGGGSSNYGQGYQQNLDLQHQSLLTVGPGGGEGQEFVLEHEPVHIVGQLRKSYIVLEGMTSIYRVDQHALAERIAFEKMRKEVKEKGFETEILLQPLSITFPATVEIEPLLEQINHIGFDVSLFGEDKIIVHAIPRIFMIYKVDVELLFGFVRGIEPVIQQQKSEQDFFDLILDEIFGMKACKASIKAGQKLSMLEMQQLIQDGIEHIEGLFVCQHGRPSIVRMDKSSIDGLFDR